MKKTVRKICSILVVLMVFSIVLSIPFTTVSADGIETDGMIFNAKNYREKGVTVKPLLGTPTQGYNYAYLFGYLLGSDTDTPQNFAPDEEFLDNAEPYKWVEYGEKHTTKEDFLNDKYGETYNHVLMTGNTDPSKTLSGFDTLEVQDSRYSWNYINGFEVDLGSVYNIGGYVLHSSTYGLGIVHNSSFDFYVSTDGETWSYISTIVNQCADVKQQGDVTISATFSTRAAGELDQSGQTKVYASGETNVHFGAAVEARYIRVLNILPKDAGEINDYCGLEVYQAKEGAVPVTTESTEVTEQPTTSVVTYEVITKEPKTTNASDQITTETPNSTATESTAQNQEKGCSSVISASAIAIVATVSAFGLALVKKEKVKKEKEI